MTGRGCQEGRRRSRIRDHRGEAKVTLVTITMNTAAKILGASEKRSHEPVTGRRRRDDGVNWDHFSEFPFKQHQDHDYFHLQDKNDDRRQRVLFTVDSVTQSVLNDYSDNRLTQDDGGGSASSGLLFSVWLDTLCRRVFLSVFDCVTKENLHPWSSKEKAEKTVIMNDSYAPIDAWLQTFKEETISILLPNPLAGTDWISVRGISQSSWSSFIHLQVNQKFSHLKNPLKRITRRPVSVTLTCWFTFLKLFRGNSVNFFAWNSGESAVGRFLFVEDP